MEKMHPVHATRIYRLQSTSFPDIAIKRFLGMPIKIIRNFQHVRHHKSFLQTIIDEERPDLIHLHWLFHPVSLAASSIQSIPVISTPWGSDLLIPEYRVNPNLTDIVKHKFVIKQVIRKSDAFCCDATHMKKLLISYGASERSIEIIYFGTDTKLFSPAHDKSFFWRNFGLKNNSLKVISNRVLADMYDIETFIRAAKRVAAVNSNIDFIIIGGGPSESKLKQYVSDLGLDKNITFTGRLEDESFAQATKSADIYVSTSPTDGGIAASVAEAMSAQIPVLITNFGDNPLWLKDESAGFIFPPGDDEVLANLILKLSNNEILRKSMGENGRQIILKENNSEIETLKVLSLYKRVTEMK